MKASYRSRQACAMLLEADLAAIDRRDAMRWEAPQAIDLRFGMEITMYIANR